MRNNFIFKPLPARIKPKLFIQLFLSLLLAVFSKTLSAQDNTNPSFKRFGFQAGVNIAAMNFNLGNPAPAEKEKLSWKAGISFGFLLRIPLAKNLFLQPEYSFIQRNGEDRSISVDYDLDYLSMPVLLNYSISSRISLLAGPQL